MLTARVNANDIELVIPLPMFFPFWILHGPLRISALKEPFNEKNAENAELQQRNRFTSHSTRRHPIGRFDHTVQSQTERN